MITRFAVKDYQQVTIHFGFCCVLQNWSKHGRLQLPLQSLCFVSSVGEGRRGLEWTRVTQMCSHSPVPEQEDRLRGPRPCLSLPRLHRETFWSNYKPEDSVLEYSSWNSPCHCPASQSVSIHWGTQREMFISHLLTPI